MILLLNTSTPVCYIAFVANVNDAKIIHEASWKSGRELAKSLLLFIQQELEKCNYQWSDLTGLVVYKGPGSFTGLRIGITVINSLAYTYSIPVVGEGGDNWTNNGLNKLAMGKDDKIVLPEYGGEANITKPRK